MSNGYGKSFPPVRALASIANATVHFRNADDLSRESPISSLVHRFLRKGGEHIFRIRISIIDPPSFEIITTATFIYFTCHYQIHPLLITVSIVILDYFAVCFM